MRQGLVAVTLIVGWVTTGVAAEEAARRIPADLMKQLTANPLTAEWYDGTRSIIDFYPAVNAVSSGGYDWSELVRHVREHPDIGGYVGLVVLRRYAAAPYKSISDSTKAAILSNALWSLPLELGVLDSDNSPARNLPYEGRMSLGEGGKALLKLSHDKALPFLRDALIDCNMTTVGQAGALTVQGNYAYWYAAGLLGRRQELGSFAQRRKLFDEMPNLLSSPKGQPLSRDIIDILTNEASAGVPLVNSSAMWRLYDAEYDFSSVPGLIEKAPDYRSYHLLMALRRCDLPRYAGIGAELRSRVLASAFEKAPDCRDWIAAGIYLPPANKGLASTESLSPSQILGAPFRPPVAVAVPASVLSVEVLKGPRPDITVLGDSGPRLCIRNMGESALALTEGGKVALPYLAKVKAAGSATAASATARQKALLAGSIEVAIKEGGFATLISPWRP